MKEHSKPVSFRYM